MGVFRTIFVRKSSLRTNSNPGRPPVFENLEPRIMLSGDGLLSYLNSPEQVYDSLINETQEVIEYEYIEITESNT